jgi:hypothetical protein
MRRDVREGNSLMPLPDVHRRVGTAACLNLMQCVEGQSLVRRRPVRRADPTTASRAVMGRNCGQEPRQRARGRGICGRRRTHSHSGKLRASYDLYPHSVAERQDCTISARTKTRLSHTPMRDGHASSNRPSPVGRATCIQKRARAIHQMSEMWTRYPLSTRIAGITPRGLAASIRSFRQAALHGASG